MASHVSTPSSNEVNWVASVINENRRIYGELHRVIHHLRRMRAMRLSGRVPRSFQRILGQGVRAPMSWALVQTIVGLISKNVPQFKRIPRKPSERAAAARLATSAWPLIQTYSRIARKPLFVLSCDQLVGDGRTIWKLRRSVWENYPDRDPGEDDDSYNRRVEDFLNSEARKSPLLRASLVDPLTFMPSREEYDASFVIETGRRPLLTTMRSLGLKFGVNNRLVPLAEGQAVHELELPSGLSPTAQVDEVWTDEYVYIRINGETLKFENEFGFIPYAWRFGQLTSIPDPVLEGTSVIFPFMGLEPWLNTLVSVVVAWSILGGTPILQMETVGNVASVPPATETPQADIPLGKMVYPAVGRRLSFVQPPAVGREVIEAVNMILGFYDRAGITPLARGLIGTRTPGLTLSSALEAASDMLTPIVKNLEGVLEDVVIMTWRAVENFGLPMWVTGTSTVEESVGPGRKPVLSAWRIDPKDIDGYYDLHCTLKLTNLQDIISRGMHAAFMKAHGLWSEDRSMEFAGVDNPEAERLERFKDRLRQTPLYNLIAIQRALEDEPELQSMVQQGQSMGLDLLGILQQLGSAGGIYGGAPQPRGGPSPMAGGRSAGAPRRPTGPRGTAPRQGQQFPS